jgi:hypothetical protein
MSGRELASLVSNNLEAAKRGDSLMASDLLDSSAWETLISVSSKYTIFDSLDLRASKSSRGLASSPRIAVCSIISSQEAYVDEWVDYHLALGITQMYLFDTSKEFWMQQWGEEKSQTAPIEVINLKGNSSDLSFIAKTYSKCLENSVGLQKSTAAHEPIALMDVNDFLMPLNTLEFDFVHGSLGGDRPNKCITQVRRVLFGNGGQFVYDPLPVTKRFQLRVDEQDSSSLYPLLLVSSVVSEKDLLRYLSSGYFESESSVKESSELISYHYIRSIKECRQQRGEIEFCYLTGDTEDSSAWKQMQKLVPEYSEYNIL